MIPNRQWDGGGGEALTAHHCIVCRQIWKSLCKHIEVPVNPALSKSVTLCVFIVSILCAKKMPRPEWCESISIHFRAGQPIIFLWSLVKSSHIWNFMCEAVKKPILHPVLCWVLPSCKDKIISNVAYESMYLWKRIFLFTVKTTGCGYGSGKEHLCNIHRPHCRWKMIFQARKSSWRNLKDIQKCISVHGFPNIDRARKKERGEGC